MEMYKGCERLGAKALIAFLSIFFILVTTNLSVIAAQPQVAAGDYHTVGLNADGTVVGVGWNGYYQLDVGGWTDIIQVAVGANHTLGLKTNGTVVAVGWNEDGQLNVGGWTNIVQVTGGWYHTVGVRSNGTVVAVGWNEDGQLNVGGWTNIVQAATGDYHTVGLRTDGTVVGVGWNGDGALNVGSWVDIVQVAAGFWHTVGLRTNGTVVATGSSEDGRLNVGGWTNIVQVAGGGHHTVGLRADGTVVAVGDNDWGQCDVGGWMNIVQVAAGRHHTVGLRADGTVVAVGENNDGQLNTSGWNLGPTAPPTMGTGIQIIGSESNIVTNVMTGDMVMFRVHALTMQKQVPGVHFRFFTRAGYGEPDWGGNKWTLVQDFSPADSVFVTFDQAGTYFLAGHAERAGEPWAFGDPQTGIVVEVSDPLGTGIQIIGSSSNIFTTVQAGDVVQFTASTVAGAGVGTIHYRFFTRAGYGEENWGGNKWTLVQDFNAMNSVEVLFSEPGIYFLACHAERAGEPWAFGDPQTGIVIEVWPAQ
jgi:hypothetical protein